MEDDFLLDNELEALTVFTNLKKLLQQKLKEYQKYIAKYNDQELETIFNDIRNIIDGYV